eukprot:4478271-Pyramimonas_sp.AAC.1
MYCWIVACDAFVATQCNTLLWRSTIAPNLVHHPLSAEPPSGSTEGAGARIKGGKPSRPRESAFAKQACPARFLPWG